MRRLFLFLFLLSVLTPAFSVSCKTNLDCYEGEEVGSFSCDPDDFSRATWQCNTFFKLCYCGPKDDSIIVPPTYMGCDNGCCKEFYGYESNSCSFGDNSSCSSYEDESRKECILGNLYWIDSCGDQGIQSQDCGTDGCDPWQTMCKDAVTIDEGRKCYDKGCENDACTEQWSIDWSDSFVDQSCGDGEVCIEGSCGPMSCSETDLDASQTQANAAPGATLYYDSGMLSRQVDFSIRLWSEDCGWDITCYNENNVPIWHNERHDGKKYDNDSSVNYFNFSCSGHRLYLWVSEGGSASSDVLGYRVRYRLSDCEEAEICNGVDDDRDGLSDYDDPDLHIPCGSVIGECEAGIQHCELIAGEWQYGDCIGAIEPAPEVCDNLDNSCNGTVDEFYEDCETGLVGICAMGRKFCSVGSFGKCIPINPPVEEICNGEDDDCDDFLDEEFQCEYGTDGCTDECKIEVNNPNSITEFTGELVATREISAKVTCAHYGIIEFSMMDIDGNPLQILEADRVKVCPGPEKEFTIRTAFDLYTNTFYGLHVTLAEDEYCINDCSKTIYLRQAGTGFSTNNPEVIGRIDSEGEGLNIPDNNIFVVVLLVLAVSIILTRKEKV